MERPFCCYDLLQMRCIARHQLLAALQRNFSPFLMSNRLQFSNILGLTCCNLLSSNPTRDFLSGSSQVTVMVSVEYSATKPRWNLKYDWDHCCVGRSSDTQLSASSQTAWCFLLGFPDTAINPSCLPHTAGSQFQTQR